MKTWSAESRDDETTMRTSLFERFAPIIRELTDADLADRVIVAPVPYLCLRTPKTPDMRG